MFYHIEGKVTELEPGLAAVDCGGIGFAVNVTLNTMSGLRAGEKAKLYISEAIGDNNFDLYGFLTKSERRCFEMLISVSGVGAKAAMSILSHTTPEGLALSIMTRDEKTLTAAPGVGKKIAQRVILELKDKIGKDMGGGSVSTSAPVTVSAGGSDALNDAAAGLAVLGYSSAEIAPVINKLDTASMTAEQIIKTVLKQMVK